MNTWDYTTTKTARTPLWRLFSSPPAPSTPHDRLGFVAIALDQLTDEMECAIDRIGWGNGAAKSELRRIWQRLCDQQTALENATEHAKDERDEVNARLDELRFALGERLDAA